MIVSPMVLKAAVRAVKSLTPLHWPFNGGCSQLAKQTNSGFFPGVHLDCII